MLLIVLGAAIGGLAFPFTPRNSSLLVGVVDRIAAGVQARVG